jgi:hypothetical protein
VVSRVLRLSSSSPAFLLSPPVRSVSFTSCCRVIFAACEEEALPISSESAFLLCRFFVLKFFFFVFFSFVGEVKGREREEGIEFSYA